MEIKWIEDFLSLARTCNFSRSAEERNVTQPAFGRRIRALERWLGTDLVDRRTYPVTLTVDGIHFRESANSILTELYQNKAWYEKSTIDFKPDLRIAASSNLILTFLPNWLEMLQEKIQPFTLSVRTKNFHDMIEDLTNAESDLVVQYYHRELPLLMDTKLVEWLTVGSEKFRLYSTTDTNGKALHDPLTQKAVPLLAYSSDGYFAQIATGILKDTETTADNFLRSVESPTANFLLELSTTSTGVLWLPENGAAPAVAAKTLVPTGDGKWDTELDIRIFFRRNAVSQLTARIIACLKEETKRNG